MRREDPFERLDPPRGGLAKLRARLVEGTPRGGAWRPPSVAALAAMGAALFGCVAVVIAVAHARSKSRVMSAHSLDGLAEVELGLAPVPAEPVAIMGTSRASAALAEVRTTDPHVVFYWVASTE